ncbi:MAG TPA: Flp family type IVb pilin [Candidatus Brocadiaceae bacterium]
MGKRLIKFLKDEEGISAVEYALIGALVSVAVFAAWTALKGKFTGATDKIGEKLEQAATE